MLSQAAKLEFPVGVKCHKDRLTTAVAEHTRPDGYALWILIGVTVVSKCSAVYHFKSNDVKRGTPYVRGSGRMLWHKTWHTTLLATVGPNNEGPLPWIERDYTPVSTWKEWEKGCCDILIKIYRTGAATSWLFKQPIGSHFWLSQPHKTLSVPSLVADVTHVTPAFVRHDSVLLVLGGTGIVTVPQVLQHSDPAACFSTCGATSARPPLTSPVSLVYACRCDDMLLVEELATWCSSSSGFPRLQRCVIAVSPSSEEAPVYMDSRSSVTENLAKLAAVPNMSVVNSHVTQEMLLRELKPLQSADFFCRVVVSGPEAFNAAVKEMLVNIGVGAETVTVLSAS